MVFLAMACFAAVWLGMEFHTERFISPKTGWGYALGIAGGSLMLLLLMYSARKRAPWLAFLGTVQGWFQTHMVLGLVGPLLVLFHSNFSLGATNSNVALFCMLVVSVSGLFGRYFYGRIHVGFEGRKSDFNELRAELEQIQQESDAAPYMSEIAMQLKVGTLQMTEGLAAVPKVLRPPFIGARAHLLRWRLGRLIDRRSREAPSAAAAGKLQRRRMRDLVARYIDAARKVVEFEAYERLFSVWHMLHLPLFFMLLLAGLVHVVAVHIY
jgi:hypothetical protein